MLDPVQMSVGMLYGWNVQMCRRMAGLTSYVSSMAETGPVGFS